MFHKRLEISKERMLDGLFQSLCVDFCSICSNLVEKRSERMVVVLVRPLPPPPPPTSGGPKRARGIGGRLR